MTPKELAAALRERFLKVQVGFPDLHDKVRWVSSDRIIEGNLRCAACRTTHTPKNVALELAAKHDTLEPWLLEMQELALRTWPKPCLLVLSGITAKLTEINAAERQRKS